MQQSPDVVVDVDGVHEDEGKLADRKGVAETAWRLALPVVQVEQPRVRHGLELRAEIRLDVLEHLACAKDEVRDSLVGPERPPAFGIGGEVPRSEPRQAHAPAPALEQTLD